MPTCGSSSFCSTSFAYCCRFDLTMNGCAMRRPIQSSATSSAVHDTASSMDGLSISSISASSKSYTMCCRISLSATKPIARNSTNSGIVSLAYGTVQRMTRSLTLRDLPRTRCRYTWNLLLLRVVFSSTDLTSAECVIADCPALCENTNTWLAATPSCTRSTVNRTQAPRHDLDASRCFWCRRVAVPCSVGAHLSNHHLFRAVDDKVAPLVELAFAVRCRIILQDTISAQVTEAGLEHDGKIAYERPKLVRLRLLNHLTRVSIDGDVFDRHIDLQGRCIGEISQPGMLWHDCFTLPVPSSLIWMRNKHLPKADPFLLDMILDLLPRPVLLVWHDHDLPVLSHELLHREHAHYSKNRFMWSGQGAEALNQRMLWATLVKRARSQPAACFR